MKIQFLMLTCLLPLFCFPSIAFGGEAPWIKLGHGLAGEKVELIDPQDLWHTVKRSTYRSADGLVIGFWQIDVESADRRDGWTLIGIALFGLGDVAESPVAVRLWSQEQLVFSDSDSENYQERNKKSALFFRRADCSTKAERCVVERVAIVPKLRGGVDVLLNNRRFGSIR